MEGSDFNTAKIQFVIFSIAAATNTSIQMLIEFRFSLELSVASKTLNLFIVCGMFDVENRGRALSVVGMTPFMTPILGPTIGGFNSRAKRWR